jgi:hypothetical protein
MVVDTYAESSTDRIPLDCLWTSVFQKATEISWRCREMPWRFIYGPGRRRGLSRSTRPATARSIGPSVDNELEF